MSDVKLSPVNFQTAKDIMNHCWERIFKKYRNYTNASKDGQLHFSPEVWEEIINLMDQIIDEFPYVLTVNICYSFFQELYARDLGAYKNAYNEELWDETSIGRKIDFFKKVFEARDQHLNEQEEDGFV